MLDVGVISVEDAQEVLLNRNKKKRPVLHRKIDIFHHSPIEANS
jgi:hypothetical protein